MSSEIVFSFCCILEVEGDSLFEFVVGDLDVQELEDEVGLATLFVSDEDKCFSLLCRFLFIGSVVVGVTGS